MGVFDGGTYRVTVYRKGDEDGDNVHTDDPRAVVDSLREDPGVRAVETHAVHYVTGAYQGELSFGDPYEDGEDVQ